MIWNFVYTGCAGWFLYYLCNLLWIAVTKGYVMALTNPFGDTVEVPQHRDANPSKFWANVIFALLFLPIAIGGVWLSLADLWAVYQQQGH